MESGPKASDLCSKAKAYLGAQVCWNFTVSAKKGIAGIGALIHAHAAHLLAPNKAVVYVAHLRAVACSLLKIPPCKIQGALFLLAVFRNDPIR